MRQYIEKLDLSKFVSISDDSSQDHNLDAARLNLNMKEESVKLTVRKYVNLDHLPSFKVITLKKKTKNN